MNKDKDKEPRRSKRHKEQGDDKFQQNPFQTYIDLTSAAWIGFCERYPIEWMMQQSDMDMIQSLWTNQAPRFSLLSMWDTYRLCPPDMDLVDMDDLYRATIELPRNKALIKKFTDYNQVPPEIRDRVLSNQRAKPS